MISLIRFRKKTRSNIVNPIYLIFLKLNIVEVYRLLINRQLDATTVTYQPGLINVK